ncbi:MAG: DUF4097 family beta strand repeat protein [Acidobacteria bacterium]|nr:DUF4097 family beta strand repeat protein [Acidobacteriota bacterium]
MRSKRFLSSSVGIVAIVIASAASSGCDVVSELGGRASDQWSRTYTVAPDGRVEISNVNGAIEVEPSDGSAVEVRADRTARAVDDRAAKQLLEKVEIRETVHPDSVVIETRTARLSGLWSGHAEVHYRVRVPASVRVKVETVNGRIELGGLKGRVQAGTTNGGITGRRIGGGVDGSTTNGGITIELDRVADEGVKLETTNGSITLRLPPDANADVSARVVNGGIDADGLSFKDVERPNRRRFSGRLNSGGARVELETTNGGIRIRGTD